MPTYEYECLSCAHAFEASQKMSDKLIDKCPKCSGKVKRLIGKGSGIIFKGSGFYETDYKRKACDKAGSSDKCSTCSGAKERNKK